MMQEIARWKDYELLDSGNGQKFERFGDFTLARPDPIAIWRPMQAEWKADATFHRAGEEGRWEFTKQPPEPWIATYKNLSFLLQPKSFKHVGIFPEQAPNWDWLQEKLAPGASLLNLFAYTGGASIAAASAGASVVHVDASKPVVDWAKENAAASNLADKPIRWLFDDVSKFIAREVRRANSYAAMVMEIGRA